jgi:outer membrane protein OmpA-like peptidoglycan-associated protein
MKFHQQIILLTAIGFLPLSLAQGQDNQVKKEYLTQNVKIADKYLKMGEGYSALEYYGKEIEENPKNYYANYQLAELYYELFDYINAEKFYKVVSNGAPGEFPHSVFWAGVTSKMNGKYVEAKGILDGFIKNYQGNSENDKVILEKAKLEFEGCRVALKELEKKERDIQFVNLDRPINTGADEYAPGLLKDSNFVLTSDRKGVKQDNKDRENEIFYSDNFFVRFNSRTSRWSVSNSSKFLVVSNTFKNDGPGSFTQGGKKYYYTSCQEEDGQCAIFVAKRKGKTWYTEKLNENINPSKTENKHPFITLKGDTLFFVSERSGGFGMQDIWYSTKTRAEEWAPAKNMGSRINSPYADISPSYYSHEKTLFFASDGREGFGGMDLFMATGEGLGFVKDLGMPFNSSRNDFYLVLGNKKGYFASDREGGKGKTDIYAFNFRSKKHFIKMVANEYLDDFKQYTALTRISYSGSGDQSVPNVTVMLVDDNGKVLKTTKTDSDGLVKFNEIPTDRNYRIVIDSDDPKLQADMRYFINDIEVVDNLSLVYYKDQPTASLKMDQKGSEYSLGDFKGFALLGSISYESGGEPAAGVPVLLLDNDGNVIKKVRTNQKGFMRFENLDTDQNYRVVLDTEDPNFDAKSGVVFNDLNLKRYDKVIENIKFENIYFGFGSKDLNQFAKETLEDLGRYYAENPDIQVDISAYTDTVGNAEFNRKLSIARANAVLEYLRLRKVDESSLVLYPMGEESTISVDLSKIIIPGVDESEKGSAFSRRVEFFIVKAPEEDE